MNSMTGYALKTAEFDDYTVHCEIKSLNNRFLELKFRLPPYVPELEQMIRGRIKAEIKRGKVEVYVRVEAKEKSELEIIKALLLKYHGIVKEIEETCDLALQVSVSELLAMRNILGHHEEYSYIELPAERIVGVFDETLAAFSESRHTEGEHTKKDIGRHIEDLKSSLYRIEEECPAIVERYTSHLKEKISELVDGKVDETRLMMEAAIYAGKMDIAEEISRINGHLKRLEGLVCGNGSCGREMDFLVQELLRETNTIGSKVGDYTVSGEVVNMKTVLDKIKEQVRNIE